MLAAESLGALVVGIIRKIEIYVHASKQIVGAEHIRPVGVANADPRAGPTKPVALSDQKRLAGAVCNVLDGDSAVAKQHAVGKAAQPRVSSRLTTGIHHSATPHVVRSRRLEIWGREAGRGKVPLVVGRRTSIVRQKRRRIVRWTAENGKRVCASHRSATGHLPQR